MDRGCAAHRALDIGFKQYVDERAPLKSLLSKPTIEYIENRQQSFVGRRCPPLHLGFKPAAGPHGFAPVQEGNRQVDLGVEIAVEAGFFASVRRACKRGLYHMPLSRHEPTIELRLKSGAVATRPPPNRLWLLG